MENINEKEQLENLNKQMLTKEQLENLYYVYSKNFLLASNEFKYVDRTLSDIFLMYSQLLISRCSMNNPKNNPKSLLENKLNLIMSSDEKDKILDEINNIEKSLNLEKIKNEECN